MDVAATVTSKGQVTIPEQIRDALDLHAGDKVVFRAYEGRATLARTPDLCDLDGIGSVERLEPPEPSESDPQST